MLKIQERNMATDGGAACTKKPHTYPKQSKPPDPNKLIHPNFNKFCRWINGETDIGKHNFFSVRDITKAVWPVYPILQLIGLFNDKAAKCAKAWYGACWSIIYSCYRPFKADREKLGGQKVTSFKELLFNTNENFRVSMGLLVSAVYGTGAFGMLFGALTDNDDLFEKYSKIYQTGMFNQNQIFASMNADIVMKRALNKEQLPLVDQKSDDLKGRVELIDTLLFIPNIITRALDTLKMFGTNVMSEGLERCVNFLGYFSYGTWATRFGIMKTTEVDQGGDLEILEQSHPVLYNLQEKSGKVFYTVLPGLSWLAGITELFGFRDFAEKTFKLEGILEKLNPAVASWCLTNPWLQGYLKMIDRSDSVNISENPI